MKHAIMSAAPRLRPNGALAVTDGLERDQVLREMLDGDNSVEIRYSRIERWELVRLPEQIVPRSNFLAEIRRDRPRYGIIVRTGAMLAAAAIGALTFALFFAAQPKIRPPAALTVSLLPITTEAGVKPLRARKAHARPKAGPAPVAQTSAKDDGQTAVPKTESEALRQAFATNEPTSWSRGDVYGMVVVGQIQIDNGRSCRDVAVLTRPVDQPAHTMNSRQCRSADGKIAELLPDAG